MYRILRTACGIVGLVHGAKVAYHCANHTSSGIKILLARGKIPHQTPGIILLVGCFPSSCYINNDQIHCIQN